MKKLLGHTKLLNLIRFSSFSSTSHFNHFTATSLKSGAVIRTILKLKVKPLKVSHSQRAFIFQPPLNPTANYLRNFRYSGIGCILGISAATASAIAYSMDVEDALWDDRHNNSQDLSEDEENIQDLYKVVGKFWLPILFFLTVLTNLDNPFTILFIKLTLFLLSTKPNPFSVYVFVDQLCQQSIREDTSSFNKKSVYASKVEVDDYKLLCLADVEVRDHKFTLVGILGTWWTLPHLPSWEARSLVGGSILLSRNEQGNS
ncbi:uncharacterized protein LOC131647239 isoform X2 [Vicia villosa]|uniref:uncharacterized protein LOC131647218 isoform X2 n=1 Tax=Vicia villosa TaxID=3911 RepID=UPI00273C34CE|nr:uncharacterized protein LOC131647218 isoform X2 [Vicia villosa]XP_058773132.1 uncharacterized protein LOC131647239 isoform X2 [Vicia villosa]